MPGAADRQVIAIGVVELDEVLAIAEDAVACRLLAARNAQRATRNAQRFTVPVIENWSGLDEQHQSAGDHQGY